MGGGEEDLVEENDALTTRKSSRIQSNNDTSVNKENNGSDSDSDSDSDDSEFEQYKDEYDENLLGDEKDKEWLYSLTEANREAEILRRHEKREKRKQIWEIKRQKKIWGKKKKKKKKK